MYLTEVPRKSSAHEQLLSPTEVATWFGVSAAWVRDHATRSEPRLPVKRLGKLLRFDPKELEEFLRAKGIAA